MWRYGGWHQHHAIKPRSLGDGAGADEVGVMHGVETAAKPEIWQSKVAPWENYLVIDKKWY